jgi:hypothetical protein
MNKVNRERIEADFVFGSSTTDNLSLSPLSPSLPACGVWEGGIFLGVWLAPLAKPREVSPLRINQNYTPYTRKQVNNFVQYQERFVIARILFAEPIMGIA